MIVFGLIGVFPVGLGVGGFVALIGSGVSDEFGVLL